MDDNLNKQITKQEAIDGIKGLFELTTWADKVDGKSFFAQQEGSDDADFFFDKRQYDRFEVISKLSEYFKDKVIIGGCCQIEPITLLWTLVHIKDYQKPAFKQKEK